MAVLQTFYNKYQSKILVSLPVVLCLGFVLFSSISALITIKTTPLPDNFEEVTAEVKNYTLYQLSPETNEKKWVLTGAKAKTNPDGKSVVVSDVLIEAFKHNALKLIMTSDTAIANEKTKEIRLEKNVKVTDPDHKFNLRSGGLKFSDDLDLLVDSRWGLTTKQGYRIEGNRGIIDKSLTKIISTGNALVTKEKLNLNADKIVFKDDKPIIATGAAKLKLDDTKSLSADKIIFAQTGNVDAQGNVGVKTDKISCFSQKLKIIPDFNRAPKVAILSGRPYVLHNGKRIAANLIRYDFALNQVSAEGNVHTEYIR